jgi:hypothetical protein
MDNFEIYKNVNMSVDEGYETGEDLLDVEDIDKSSDFSLPLYLPDDFSSKNDEIIILQSVATANLRIIGILIFFRETILQLKVQLI